VTLRSLANNARDFASGLTPAKRLNIGSNPAVSYQPSATSNLEADQIPLLGVATLVRVQYILASDPALHRKHRQDRERDASNPTVADCSPGQKSQSYVGDQGCG